MLLLPQKPKEIQLLCEIAESQEGILYPELSSLFVRFEFRLNEFGVGDSLLVEVLTVVSWPAV